MYLLNDNNNMKLQYKLTFNCYIIKLILTNKATQKEVEVSNNLDTDLKSFYCRLFKLIARMSKFFYSILKFLT